MARFTSHSRERVGQKNKARGGKNTVTITNRGKIPRRKKSGVLLELLDKNPELWKLVDVGDVFEATDERELMQLILKKARDNEKQKRDNKKYLREKIKQQLGIDLDSFQVAEQMSGWSTRKSELEDAESQAQFLYIIGKVKGHEALTSGDRAALTTYYSDEYKMIKGYILSQLYDRNQYYQTEYYRQYIRAYEEYIRSMRVSERILYIKKMEFTVKNLKSALAKAPMLTTSTTLYHGGKLEVEEIGQIGEFILPTSTSYQSNIGDDFANDPSRYAVVVHAPRGIKGLLGSTKTLAGMPHEHEVTFPIGQKYLVLDVEKDIHDNISKVEILLLPDGVDSFEM